MVARVESEGEKEVAAAAMGQEPESQGMQDAFRLLRSHGSLGNTCGAAGCP